MAAAEPFDRVIRVVAERHPGLASSIAQGLADARVAWPAGREPDDDLAAYLAERVGASERPHVMELYLAWWALRDSRGAAAFEARYAEDIERVVRRFARLDADELRQILRVKLLVTPGKLAEYTGRGPLHSWLRVVAARVFVDVARGRTDAVVDDPDGPLLALASTPLDVVREIDRPRVRTAIREAFAAAVAALRDRERTFLRLVTNEGMTLEQVAATYAVGRATVARDLASARARLRELTRQNLQARLELTPAELDSVIRGVDSNLELSLAALVA